MRVGRLVMGEVVEKFGCSGLGWFGFRRKGAGEWGHGMWGVEWGIGMVG